MSRSLTTIQNKWKYVKGNAKKRESAVKKSLNKTGGGSLSAFELKLINSPWLEEVCTKLGVSSRGAPARHDSDKNGSRPVAKTPLAKRRLLTVPDEDSNMSTQSTNFDEKEEEAVAEKTSENVSRSGSFLYSSSPTGSGNESSQNSFDLTSTSNSPTNSQELVSNPSPINSNQKRHVRDFQLENAQQLNENLLKQKEGAALQGMYWKMQFQKSQVSKDHEVLKMQTTRIGIETASIEKQKSEDLMRIEIEKQAQLAQIEIETKRELAQLEIEAKRKELGLEKRTNQQKK